MTPDAIKAARTAHGLSQSQAALLIGASVRTWQEWEQGRRKMPAAKWALFNILINGSK